MLGGGKAAHIGPDLGNDGGRRIGFDLWDRLKKGHFLCTFPQPLLDFLLDLCNGLFQKINMGQDVTDKEAMVGLNEPIQCLLQLGDLLSQTPTS